jgi:Uma2 family endonuclease
MLAVAQGRKYTVEEYLAMDDQSEIPLEFQDGDVFPLEASTPQHGLVLAYLSALLVPQLRGKGCQPIGPARLPVSASKYLSPDLRIECGGAPKVIFEILSPSTGGYDSGPKFNLYRQLPSFEEYVLISQTEPAIEVRRKHESRFWTIRLYEGLEDTALVESLDLKLPLADLYPAE